MQHKRTTHFPLFEGYCRKNAIDSKEIVATISGTKVTLKVAANEDTKAKGYMGSDEPINNDGMLFVYEMPDDLGFWMKNVSFALDIIFFDDKFNYINHHTMDPYDGEQDSELQIYKSDKPAMYAVELKSGWVESNTNGSNITLKI
jgi:uncharacterized protein